MEIKIRRRKNKDDVGSAAPRPSLLIVLFLGAIFILSTVNLIKDLSSQQGIRPFGFIEEIIAQVTNTSNPPVNISQISSLAVKDNTDRCVAINPATGKAYRNSAGKSSSVTGKAGINQGDVGDGIDGRISFVQGENSTGQDLGMGYTLSMFTSPSDFESAASYVKKTVDAGMIPIVRLCYPGNCNFRMDNNSIIDFYRNLNSRLEEGYEFVGLIGPNEPTTSGEMVSFGLGDGDYTKMFEHVNRISSELQNIRVSNGGKMYIAPIAFNLINTLGDISLDDFRQFRNHQINTDNLDYLLGNIYDSVDLGYNSYEVIVNSGLKEFAEDKGLQIILSEYGIFDQNPTSLELARNNFNQLCSDAIIDGIVFFRSFEEISAPDPKPTQLTTEFIASLSQSCTRQRPWLNCNFDSAIYPDHPNKVNLVPGSLADSSPSFVNNEEDNESKGAGLLVSCNGNDCSARMISTIQAKLPVKQFGSNSSFGTKTKSYTPISSEVAMYTSDTDYDPLNQFAGELTGNNGLRYPMPLLGSAINSTTQLSLYLPHFARFPTLRSYPNPGSFSSNLRKEILGDMDKEGLDVSLSYRPESQSIIQNNIYNIPDERIVNVNGNNIDKTDQNYVKGLRKYDPLGINFIYKKPNGSYTGDMKYLNNSDDYINGPEVIVEEKTYWSGSGGELCRLYGERNRSGQSGVELETTSNLNCRVNSSRVIPLPTGGQARCSALVSCNFQNGVCSINPAYSSCIDYTPSPEDKVYIYTKDYPTIPRFQIKNVWDALYRQYQMLQDSLESKGYKMIFRENIGWKSEYQSFIRDANRSVSDPEKYYYSSTDEELEFNQNGITGSAYQPKLFENNALFAKGKYSMKSEQYYDWLGYLDIIQEMRMAYLYSTELTETQKENNPYFNIPEKPNNTRKDIFISGTASQVTTFPVMTCDQVELCKQKNQLIADLGEEEANRLCPIDPISSNVALTCITDKNDSRFENKLETSLCGRGYHIEGICELRCIAAPVDSAPGGGIGSADSTISSIQDLNPNLIGLTENIENTMCLPKGILISLMEREIRGFGLGNITGDPYQRIYPRSNQGQAVWGPAQFHNISWYGEEYRSINGRAGTGYGELDGVGFNGSSSNYSYGTLKCLEALGIDYTKSEYFEEGKADVLERSYIGYALCGAAAKLKNDSRTGAANCNQWTQEDVFKAAQAYLGDCSQNNVPYCKVYVETMCRLYGNTNPSLCQGSFENQTPRICIPTEIDPNIGICEDGQISLKYPFKSNVPLYITQNWGGSGLHNGVDFGVSEGTEVLAAATGTVHSINNTDSYANGAGKFVSIKHIFGNKVVYTLYEHLSDVYPNIIPGKQVTIGTPIGKSGNTGNSTGPHLHFELRVDKNYYCYDGAPIPNTSIVPKPLGTCTNDPMKYMFFGNEPNCNIGTDPIPDGEYACPVGNPGSASIYQYSDGTTPQGRSGGSHSSTNNYNQWQQKPTDIRAPGQDVIAPISGRIIEVRDPSESLAIYGNNICDGLRLPDNSGYSYDGGFVIHLLDNEGRLWRFVHIKDIQVKEGDLVRQGQKLAKVYDGQLGIESNYDGRDWSGWSVQRGKRGCFDINNQHLHFAIISSNAIQNDYFAGNTFDSTPWVKQYCGLQ